MAAPDQPPIRMETFKEVVAHYRPLAKNGKHFAAMVMRYIYGNPRLTHEALETALRVYGTQQIGNLNKKTFQSVTDANTTDDPVPPAGPKLYPGPNGTQSPSPKPLANAKLKAKYEQVMALKLAVGLPDRVPLRDCTPTQLIFAADQRKTLAAKNMAWSTFYSAVAALVVDQQATTVGDVNWIVMANLIKDAHPDG